VWFGFYNVAADDAHTRPFYALLENVRDRSITRRAKDIAVPGDLGDRTRIVQGAGNYDAMCAGCHRVPGGGPTELSRGLYPAPLDLTAQPVDAARAYWVIRHGIKASGMPAWGHGMDDVHLWNLVAFVQVLPTMDADTYRELVAASGGHSHGGGETDHHAPRAADPPPPVADTADIETQAADEPVDEHADHDHDH
jgi:mono/diheme cytochrome c family protein